MINKIEHKDKITYYWIENIQGKEVPIGRLVADIKYTEYDDFEEVMSEKKFNETFTNDRYIEIDFIMIDPGFRRQGIGRKLLNEIIHNNNHDIKTFYLNAHPIKSSMSLDGLVTYYKNFGFEAIVHDTHNVEMVLNI
jgi:GNAT superfamily N-acetyltransferase